MGIGEAISKGLGVAKKSMGLVLLLFVFGAVFNVLNVFLAPPVPVEGAEPTPPSPAMIAVGVVFIFLTIYFQGGSMAYVRDSVKSGAATLASFTAGGGKYYVKLLLLGLLVAAVIGVFVLLAALVAGFLGSLVPFLAIPAAILLGALGIYFVVLLFLSPYAAVADDQGVGASIKLSMKLVKKNILKLLGISLLVIVIGFGVGLVLGALLAGISVVIKAQQPVQIVFAVLSSFVNAWLGVFVTAAFMNFYLSLPDRNNA
jgi:hypothetical protein